MADFEAWLVFLILVVNVVGELQRKRTLAASRGFLAAARLSCIMSSVTDREPYSRRDGCWVQIYFSTRPDPTHYCLLHNFNKFKCSVRRYA